MGLESLETLVSFPLDTPISPNEGSYGMSSFKIIRNPHAVSVMAVLTYLPARGVVICEINFPTLIMTVDALNWESVVTQNECSHQQTQWESGNLEDGFGAIWGLLGEPVYGKGDCHTVPATFSHRLEPMGLLISHRGKGAHSRAQVSLIHL